MRLIVIFVTAVCLTSYLATMAKEKEFLQHLGNCFVGCWPEGTLYDLGYPGQPSP